MALLKRFIYGMDAISEWSSKVLLFLIPVMVVALVIEVISRYFFLAPTVWAHEVSIFAWGYTIILGGAYVVKHNAHIRVDILVEKASARTKAILNVIMGLLLFFFISILIYETTKYAIFSIQINEHSVTAWSPPMAHFRVIVPIGALLLLLESIAVWVKNLYFAIYNKDLMK